MQTVFSQRYRFLDPVGNEITELRGSDGEGGFQGVFIDPKSRSAHPDAISIVTL